MCTNLSHGNTLLITAFWYWLLKKYIDIASDGHHDIGGGDGGEDGHFPNWLQQNWDTQNRTAHIMSYSDCAIKFLYLSPEIA